VWEQREVKNSISVPERPSLHGSRIAPLVPEQVATALILAIWQIATIDGNLLLLFLAATFLKKHRRCSTM
jgi:hypothetical protein